MKAFRESGAEGNQCSFKLFFLGGGEGGKVLAVHFNIDDC